MISPQKRQVENGSQSTPTTFSPCRSYAHFLQVPSSEHVPKIKIESNKKWKGPAIGSHSFFSSCRLTLMLGVRTHHWFLISSCPGKTIPRLRMFGLMLGWLGWFALLGYGGTPPILHRPVPCRCLLFERDSIDCLFALLFCCLPETSLCCLPETFLSPLYEAPFACSLRIWFSLWAIDLRITLCMTT